MKSYLLFTAFTIGITIPSLCQENTPAVLAAGGGIAASNNMVLEWTLGEVAAESITSTAALYTQGYHQPVLFVRQMKSPKPVPDIKGITVFPNPTTSVVNIQLSFMRTSTLSVVLMDMRGRLLIKKEIYPKDRFLQLNVKSYASASYFLRISNADNSILQSYKIIKTQ